MNTEMGRKKEEKKKGGREVKKKGGIRRGIIKKKVNIIKNEMYDRKEYRIQGRIRCGKLRNELHQHSDVLKHKGFVDVVISTIGDARSNFTFGITSDTVYIM